MSQLLVFPFMSYAQTYTLCTSRGSRMMAITISNNKNGTQRCNEGSSTLSIHFTFYMMAYSCSIAPCAMNVNHNNEQHAVRQQEYHNFYRLEVVVSFKMTGIKKQFQVFIIQNPTHQYSQANSKYNMHICTYILSEYTSR